MPEDSPLESLRVLDLSLDVSGAFCARLFAASGADVIAIEAPGGSPLRSRDAWDYLAAGKKSLTLDLTSEDGRDLLRALMEETEVIVETFPAGHLESIGLGFEELRRLKRRIVLVSLPPDEGASAEARWQAGLEAFLAALASAMAGDANDNPQHIEISISESAAVSAALTQNLSPTANASAGVPDLPGLDDEGGPTPAPGEHTESILSGELGATAAQLADLRQRRVV